MIRKNMDESNKGFMKHLGGLELKQVSEKQYEFIVEVKEMHLNTGKIAHGGFLSTVADTGMGTAAHRVAGDRRCVTINLDMKFISVGQLGDKLIGKVKILKKTKTLVFINCEISNAKEIVVSSSGTWKIL
tara:strand:- start:186 stop:575 length:390 start_codon:yes stop_codon:yes gene_type:complete